MKTEKSFTFFNRTRETIPELAPSEYRSPRTLKIVRGVVEYDDGSTTPAASLRIQYGDRSQASITIPLVELKRALEIDCPECRYELRTGGAAPVDHTCTKWLP